MCEWATISRKNGTLTRTTFFGCQWNLRIHARLGFEESSRQSAAELAAVIAEEAIEASIGTTQRLWGIDAGSLA